jgi:hypothetical protein
MEFFIKRNATLPVLKLQVVKDGRSDYNNFMELLETSTIFFSMVNTQTGVPKIVSRPGGFVEKIFDDPNAEPEYYIYYQFSKQDTSIEGRYEGQFLIKTFEGNIILPVREKLYINIQDSFIADELEYNTCYTSVFPCCGNPNLVEDVNINNIDIVPQYYPGSIGVLYTATSRYPVDSDVTVSFKNVLGVLEGEPITINTSITIYTGYKESTTEIIVNDDFNRLNLYTLFSDVTLTTDALSQYNNVPVVVSPLIIEPVGPRPRPTFRNGVVTSCCDNTNHCMSDIPTNLPVGTTLVGDDGYCYVLKGFVDCVPDLSFSGEYYKDCRYCERAYPCDVVKPTPTPTPTPTQDPCLITPTPTPTPTKVCETPILNTVINTSGNTFLVYTESTGCCNSSIITVSSSLGLLTSVTGNCLSPVSITLTGSLPSILYFTVTTICDGCPTTTSNTIIYYVVKPTRTPTPTPTSTIGSTPKPTTTPTPTPNVTNSPTVTPTMTQTPTSTITPTPTNKVINRPYRVQSCCGTKSGVVILPPTFSNGNTIVINLTCWTIIGIAQFGSLPSLVWTSGTTYSSCESCTTINPCTVTPTPTPTITQTKTPTPTVTRTPVATKSPTPSPTMTTTPTVTPTVTSSPLPPTIAYFQDCCNPNFKFKVGSITTGFTTGQTYYVVTKGYTGCTTVISATTVSTQFDSITTSLVQIDCNDCITKLAACSTPTPTPTVTNTPTPTTSSIPTCNNCGITAYNIIISDNTNTQNF